MRFSESVPSGIAPKHPFSCSGCLFASSWFSLFRKCSLKCSSALQVSFFNSRPLHSALMKETGVCNYKQDSPPTGMFSENSRKHTSTDSNVFWIKLQVFFQSEQLIRIALTDMIPHSSLQWYHFNKNVCMCIYGGKIIGEILGEGEKEVATRKWSPMMCSFKD